MKIWHSALSLEEYGLEIVKNSSEDIKDISLEIFKKD